MFQRVSKQAERFKFSVDSLLIPTGPSHFYFTHSTHTHAAILLHRRHQNNVIPVFVQIPFPYIKFSTPLL